MGEETSAASSQSVHTRSTDEDIEMRWKSREKEVTVMERLLGRLRQEEGGDTGGSQTAGQKSGPPEDERALHTHCTDLHLVCCMQRLGQLDLLA